MNINRDYKATTLTILIGAALTGVLDFQTFAAGILTMPAAWTAASIGFKVCSTPGGTFLPLYDSLGNLFQITAPAASKAYQLPDELFGAHFVQLWSQNGAGVDAAQAAERSIGVMLKG